MDRIPEVTVTIVTRNRCQELRRALASATAQEGAVEVVVIDDGSEDETAEMVRREFPAVELVRFEERKGLVVRRNDAARVARGAVLVSIDDDAVFSSPGTVAQTLRDFEDPRIAAVAIPYRDVLPDGSGRVPDTAPGPGAWVAHRFRGTAYALRRDVFLALGGFREEIVHQGEEDDFCLRLLAAGYVVGTGRADPIYHYPSGSRDLERMDVYGQRNVLLSSFTLFPLPLAAPLMAGYAVRALVHGARVRRPAAMVRGLGEGLRACWRLRGQRDPVPWRVAWLDWRLRRAGQLRLEDVVPALPPMRAAG